MQWKVIIFSLLAAAAALAQPRPLSTPWRGAGPIPCVGSDGGILQCPPAPRVIAVRAGRLFDSKTGRCSRNKYRAHEGDRITDVGPEDQIKIPAGAQVIDLGQRHRAARPDRRAHAHVQYAQARTAPPKTTC